MADAGSKSDSCGKPPKYADPEYCSWAYSAAASATSTSDSTSSSEAARTTSKLVVSMNEVKFATASPSWCLAVLKSDTEAESELALWCNEDLSARPAASSSVRAAESVEFRPTARSASVALCLRAASRTSASKGFDATSPADPSCRDSEKDSSLATAASISGRTRSKRDAMNDTSRLS